MDPAKLDRRVTFRRRQVLAQNARGEFVNFFGAWAAYAPSSSREAIESGRPTDIETGLIRIRDSAKGRELTGADRVMIAGREFSLQAVGLPDRRTGLIDITVTTSRQTAR